MANTVKTTKRDYFTALRSFITEGTALTYPTADVVAFIDNELSLLEKKANRSTSKPTKAQTENEVIKTAMVEMLVEIGKPLTISELMTTPALCAYSNQKLSALAKQLVDSGIIVKTVDKKKSYFSVVKSEDTEIDETEDTED